MTRLLPSRRPSNIRAVALAVVRGLVLAVVFVSAVLTSSPVVAAERTKVYELNDIRIDGIYRSMLGPEKKRSDVNLLAPDESKHVWITKFRVEVLDAKRDPTKQEFMCHSGLLTPMSKPFLAIAQGQTEIKFPEGWALRTLNEQFTFQGMVLNNNYEDMNELVNMRSTISYVDDADASAMKLKPLSMTVDYIAVPTVAGPDVHSDKVCLTASDHVRGIKKGKTTHWMVPPGRHEYRHEFGKLSRSTNIHYMWMHVHPFAEFIEIWDRTAAKTMWRGEVENDDNLAAVLHTEHYSDPIGLPFDASHEYEIITVYNNITDHDIDAMASVWIYFAD